MAARAHRRRTLLVPVHVKRNSVYFVGVVNGALRVGVISSWVLSERLFEFYGTDDGNHAGHGGIGYSE